MSDSENQNDAQRGGKKTLTLKGGGGARSSVSRSGRTTVVVEKRTRRIITPGGAKGTPATSSNPAVKPTVGKQAARVAPPPASPARRTNQGSRPVSQGGLTQAEADARTRVLREAAARSEEDQRKEAENVTRRQEIDARRKAERQETERAQQELEQSRHEKELRAAKTEKAEQAKKSQASEPVRTSVNDIPPPVKEGPTRQAPLVGKEELERAKRRSAPAPDKKRSAGDGRRQTRLTVTTALSGDSERDRGPSLAAMRRRREKQRMRSNEPAAKVIREVIIPEAITIAELANRMTERSVDVIKILMQQGHMATVNDVLDADTAELITVEMGHTVKRVAESDVEEGLFDEAVTDDDENQVARPPVVTIMGHVDHGKTSLLDALRDANVVAGEAGGITQHIGAYQVERDGRKITFLDTPGHEAFTAMRARGAQATDIVVLVVAANDGVMPQTIEAIQHAKAAGVPMIIAINKMDVEGADPARVRNELLQHEVFVESMGGDVLEAEISALKKQNLEAILDNINLQTELLEINANPDATAKGLVVEARLDKGRGPVATVLVQRGTLRIGDIVVAGEQWAKVRALINDQGERVDEAGPSMPVEVLGFTGTPSAGDRFAVVESESRAREIAEYRERTRREKTPGAGATSLEQMMVQLQADKIANVPLMIKGDVQGSVEAIIGSLDKLATEEVRAQILASGVGGITESDVTLAAASKAVILGFNVRANKQAQQAAEREGIEIRYYNIIYNLLEDVKGVMSGLLAPEIRETFIGNAEILEVFNITKVGKIAGCRVTEGMVERGAGVRLIRDNVVIHEGKLSTLKRFKDEVKDVQGGQECGMAFENYQDMRAGDVIECYRIESIERSL